MRVTQLSIPEVLLIEPRVFGDSRGFFYETFNASRFRSETGIDVDFVQDNHSRSTKGVLRGLHYQLEPRAQGKLVWATRGAVFDVAVDLRRSSCTFGQWVGVELNDVNHKQLWIPPGFGHGFLVLSEIADFSYKATAYYAPESERSVSWNDSDVGIQWPAPEIGRILSAKDEKASPLATAELYD